MWKRLQGHSREKEKQIGNPVLIETTYDEGVLDRARNIRDLKSPTHPPNAQYSSPTDHSPALPALPSPQALQVQRRDNRMSNAPTASSIYSQPSPDVRANWSGGSPAAYEYADVSPPSSPEGDAHYRQRGQSSSRDVSPVEDGRGALGRGMSKIRGGSAIPVLRKAAPERSTTSGTGRGKASPSGSTRWDVYSGEPTTSQTGRPGQVNPLSFSNESFSPPNSDKRALGYQVSISGGEKVPKKNIPTERGARFNAKPLTIETKPREPWKGASGRTTLVQPMADKPAKPREPWKGASGRTTLVQPMADKPAKQPLSIPSRSHRAPNPENGNDSGRSTPSSAAVTVKRLPMEPETSSVSPDADPHEDPIKPTVPLKVGRNSPPRGIASPTSPNSQKTSYPSPLTPRDPNQNQNQVPGNANQGISKFRAAIQQYTGQSNSPPSQTKVNRKSIDSTATSGLDKEEKVPLSRFSWTTYATNTTYQHSPPPSPPPPMPTTINANPQPVPAAASAAASILNRRRPVQTETPSPTPRKPVPAQSAQPTPSPSPSSRRMTFGKFEKDLPRPPPELDSKDHIATLEAQMDDLRLRRSNVNRLLNDLNKQAPANPLVTDFRKMRERERRIKEFEEEVADIAREEHDTGLKLHRAWRKREREDPQGMESALWVRRVTG